MLAVHLVHLRAELLRLLAVLLAQLLDLGRDETLLVLNAPLRAQLPVEHREQHGADQQREHHNGEPEGADRLQDVDAGKGTRQLLEQPLERGREEAEDVHEPAFAPAPASRRRRASRQLTYSTGTGSYPPAWKGWQRAMRRTASHQPRLGPNRWIAS